MARDVKYPEITVQLSGTDGNAFAVMGAVQKAMRKANVPETEIEAYREKSMSGDYDALLRTAMETVNVE